MESYTGLPAVVVTSISAPNAVLQEIAGQCKQRGYSFYVIGDVPIPPTSRSKAVTFYSLERQRGVLDSKSRNCFPRDTIHGRTSGIYCPCELGPRI